MGAKRHVGGGLGDDTYIMYAFSDSITEYAGEGTDLVQSAATYSLNTVANTYVENLTLTGTTNINGTGNANDNVITGAIGNNVLTGWPATTRLMAAPAMTRSREEQETIR